jgi:hypothetical protein
VPVVSLPLRLVGERHHTRTPIVGPASAFCT